MKIIMKLLEHLVKIQEEEYRNLERIKLNKHQFLI